MCLNKTDYMELVNLCVHFGAFMFEGQEYKHNHELAMNSPLSVVMASHFKETLEVDEFVHILGKNCKWFCFVEDVLVVIPKV